MWSLVQVALLLVGLAVLVLLGALLRPAWSWWATTRAQSGTQPGIRPGTQPGTPSAVAAGPAATPPPEELRARSDDLDRRDRRLTERESRLDLAERELEARARTVSAAEESLTARRAALTDLETERRLVLERTAGLTAVQARAQLVSSIENEAKREAALTVRDLERRARDEGDRRARAIITTVVQRLATEQTTEAVVTTLQLPSDELKGRIIGRDGRNIRAFEQITGVNVIVDETPASVMLSCFDPVRREVGRMTLEHLVLDGRIHPRRIEELYVRSLGEVEQTCLRAGEDAVAQTGLTDLHPELVRLLGTLRFRTSYGQNVLRHLVESASIAAMLAAELGLDPALARRCGLLHDIGKALTHQVEGSHAIVGAELARTHGENPEVVHAIEAHHDEVEPRTVEAVLTQAADAISGGRPGARRESLAAYVQRLERLEEIARSYPGVASVHAMRSGRDVRVMVVPTEIDDLQAQVLARDIAKRVETELTYPGQIRVTVIRETRATETAL
ncbi:ribonucrease Y [Actinopolymorpha cephalotaxi]|uniref:Ribonuclease Y n=1 Tax=Actinopolymorpha cephalotaxi TaxID=504797 RepID=A0A1I2R913_9ACTN|nr:ribonuclease Y [Actinopolymorpha cephalotaxi]NYH82393.1 ribonuclease Y [Actinopolymorpha cephalotaxi]SFG34361.1 ribonucrease Y [Actinopolymorpha cephalotaxi]